MDKSYDLTLNNWGPYNKEYAGVSNVLNDGYGTTFNVEVFPGLFRRNVLASTLLVDGGVKPWQANANLTNYTYRYELEWKDLVYVDVNYNISNDKRVDIKCNFVNNSNTSKSLNVNLCASLQPQKLKLGAVPLGYKTFYKPSLVGKTNFINALDYDSVKTNQTIASSGLYLGEKEYDNVCSPQGTALSGDYFNNNAHFTKYLLNGEEISSFGVRYLANSDCDLKVLINQKEYLLHLEKSVEFSYKGITLPNTKVNEITLIPNSAVTIDVLCYGENASSVTFSKIEFERGAEREVGGEEKTVTELPIVSENGEYLKLFYKSVNKTYIIRWDYPISLIRRFYCDDIGAMLCYRTHDHVNHWWKGVGDGIFDNVLSQPIYLESGESKQITFTVFEEDENTPYIDNFIKPSVNDNKYSFSQNLARANLYLNTVYPIYSRRSYIRHNTPGRFWDCLYTWDSGLIGIGLASQSYDRAIDNLKAYLTPVNDIHSPFIASGSTVPTQVLLYKYLFDNYIDKRDELKQLYKQVKQIFDFYANLGKENNLNSGILNAWKYCYNSGGWDDYPPQKHLFLNTVNKTGLENHQNTSPVITTAFTVLIGKILREIALYFGFNDDYTSVINDLSNKVESLLWNDETGYYSYLVHDKNGNPVGFLKAKDGSDYNQGFDGAYPIVSGISDSYRTKRVIENVKKGMITKYGLSVVDTRASYYSNTGYWNGSVWIPHGYILWNALLDLGEIELASDIAKAYLDTFDKETNETYSLFEHFMLKNGKGAGYHNFSGLSSPILNFYSSYFDNDKVSVGYETVILSKTPNEIVYKTTKDTAYLLLNSNSDNITINNKKAIVVNSFSNAKYIKLEKGEGAIKY